MSICWMTGFTEPALATAGPAQITSTVGWPRIHPSIVESAGTDCFPQTVPALTLAVAYAAG